MPAMCIDVIIMYKIFLSILINVRLNIILIKPKVKKNNIYNFLKIISYRFFFLQFQQRCLTFPFLSIFDFCERINRLTHSYTQYPYNIQYYNTYINN